MARGYENRTISRLLCTVACVMLTCGAHGQILNSSDKKLLDSTRISNNRFINKLFQQAINSVKKTPDTGSNDIYTQGRAEAPFLPYDGKYIRHINVESLDFEREFTDTANQKRSWSSRLANAVHTNTRNFVIKDNLFIKEKTQVDPYKLADNERFLRSLDYIHDARIVVQKIKGEPDSVDLLVVTKDFFSISGDGAANGPQRINARLIDANLAGMGQRVEVTGLYDENRSPNVAYGALYRKYNVAHSFIDATIGYSKMNNSLYTREEDNTAYLNLSRPLLSPNAHFAGGLLLSHSDATNRYHFIDSNFYSYNYNLFDSWVGYNLCTNPEAHTNNARTHAFVALRYFNYAFNDLPAQRGQLLDPTYNSKQAVLGQLTLFKQDYFKTQYIYGFGTTEDLPYGYNVSVIGGWHKQLYLERPYAGINALDYIATQRGDFIQVFLRTGGYYYKHTWQDASIMLGATAFSRLFFLGGTKVRQYVSLSYTQLNNRQTVYPLRIDNDAYGIRGFLSDSAYGSKRITLQLETAFYLKYKILGFKFAPFPYADMSILTPEGKPFNKSVLYTGIGGGFRARNENLVFETIELRAYFFPIAPDDMRGFKVVLRSNIRYRYNSNYIVAPDVVQVNN